MEQKYKIGNEYGDIMWDINRILKDKAKFPIREFDVEALVAKNYFHGNAEYAMNTDLNEPLIVVNLISDIDKLIDGNHRLFKAKKLGHQKITAYYLSIEEHCRYIVDFNPDIYRLVVNHWSV